MDMEQENRFVKRLVALSAEDSGFTLIEITFAILILASSLAVILGLQASVVDRTLRDTRQEQAMLLSRRILSVIEAGSASIDIDDKAGPALDILKELGGSDALTASDNLIKDLFQAHYRVEYQGIRRVHEKAMKKITLDISWGPSPLDLFHVVYFIPNDELIEDPNAP